MEISMQIRKLTIGINFNQLHFNKLIQFFFFAFISNLSTEKKEKKAVPNIRDEFPLHNAFSTIYYLL